MEPGFEKLMEQGREGNMEGLEGDKWRYKKLWMLKSDK